MKKIGIAMIAALLFTALLGGCQADQGSQPGDNTTGPETQTQSKNDDQTQQAPQTQAPAQELIRKIPMWEQTTWDLDGDGIENTICCSATLDENELPVLSVIIDGKECFSGQMRYWDALADYYYVVDLYTNDKQKEIALLDYGPSSDLISVFYAYHDGFLEEMGSVSGFVGEAVNVNGDSTVTAMKRLSVLQTWWGETTWVLNETNQLQELPQALYYPTSDSNVDATLRQDLTVYCGMDTQAQCTSLLAGTQVKLYATDNCNWVGFYVQDVLYWVYMEDGWNILADGQTYAPYDVFDGLFMAD